MGEGREAMNISTSRRRWTRSLRRFRDRFGLPVPDDQLDACPT